MPPVTFLKAIQESGMPAVTTTSITVIVWALIFGWFVVRAVYLDHQRLVGDNQSLLRANSTLVDPKSRDDEIKDLKNQLAEAKKSRGKQETSKVSAGASQPRALSDLQTAVLLRDLSAGAGLKVRINAVGQQSDTLSFAEELRRVFKGWNHCLLYTSPSPRD